MSKVSGAYKSLSRGVSQQAPEARLDGQHTEQLNMLSDPVLGLSRRRGSRRIAASPVGQETQVLWPGADGAYSPSNAVRYLEKMGTQEFKVGVNEYVFLYPKAPSTPSIVGSLPTPANMCRVLHKQGDGTGAWKTVTMSTAAQTRINRGVSAITVIGDYTIMATNGDNVYTDNADGTYTPQGASPKPGAPVPGLPEGDYLLGDSFTGEITNGDFGWTNNSARWMVWVRAAGYNKNYTVNIKFKSGGTYIGNIISPSATYTVALNTSDIPYSATDYTKQVNDRINAYNNARDQYIADAAVKAQPSWVASQLASIFLAAIQWAGNTGSRVGQGQASGNVAYAASAEIAEIAIVGAGADDIYIVNTVVDSPSKLPPLAPYGKVVQVAIHGADPYYMRADYVTSTSAGLAQVRWVEAARFAFYPPAPGANPNVVAPHEFPFLVMARRADGSFYIGGSSKEVRDNVPTAGDLPDMAWRQTGDRSTSPTPYWWGKTITHMTTFQDRLVVCAGNVVSMSKTADYFNFWRNSILTVKDDDPVEAYVLGSEADVIRSSVIFDKSLLFFGDLQQYSIDGRNPITPATTTIIQSSSIEGATEADPLTNGDFVFFAKRRERYTHLYQIAIGNVADTSNSMDVSLQLATYMRGRPLEVNASTAPDMLLVRTSENPRGLYTFRYIDKGEQRLLDAWSRWEYSPSCGMLIGTSTWKDRLLLFFWREPLDRDPNPVAWLPAFGGGTSWLVVDSQSLLSETDEVPYLDSARKWAVYDSSTQDWKRTDPGGGEHVLHAAFDKNNLLWLQGDKDAANAWTNLSRDFPGIGAGDQPSLWVGAPYKGAVTLTSPFRRDQNDNAIMVGRLTVGRLDVSVRNSGGFAGVVSTSYGMVRPVSNFLWDSSQTNYGVKTNIRFNGRVLGKDNNVVGVAPVTSCVVPMFVGRDSRDYRVELSSVDWKPFTITSIGWTGQWFLGGSRA